MANPGKGSTGGRTKTPLLGHDPIPGIIWAFRFGPDGVARPIGPHDPFECDAPLVWIHVNLVDQRACRWLATQPRLPQVARAFLQLRDPQQFFGSEEGALLLAIDDFTRESIALEALRTGVLHVVASNGVIVTGRHLPLRATDAIGLEGDRGQLRATTSADILRQILDKQVGVLETIVNDLDAKTQSIEDLLLMGEPPSDNRLVLLRRRLVQMHRLLRGTRATMQRLERDKPTDVPEGFIELGENFAQRFDGLDADVLAIQEHARLLQEELNAEAAQTSNRSLTLLSGMTALFLPPTLVTGFFGMNTGNLPLTNLPAGTIVASFLLLLAIYITYLLLKRNRFL